MGDFTIEYVENGMGKNPASVNLDTKVIKVNAPLFKTYTPLQKNVVLLHEKGHVHYDTVDNEEWADRFALELLAGSEPQSLRKSVDALLGVLASCEIPESRKKAVIISALRIDAERFGNEHARQLLDELEKEARVANCGVTVAAVTAIVMAAIALIGLLQQTIFGKRAEWFVGDMGGKKKNQRKITFIEQACDSVGAKAIKLKASSADEDGGYSAIIAQLDNESWVFNEVHAALYPAFKDNNIFSPAFFRSASKFYKNVSWAKDYIREYLPTVKQNVRDEYVKRGYQFKNEEIQTSSSTSSSRNLVFIIAALLVVVFLFKRK